MHRTAPADHPSLSNERSQDVRTGRTDGPAMADSNKFASGAIPPKAWEALFFASRTSNCPDLTDLKPKLS